MTPDLLADLLANANKPAPPMPAPTPQADLSTYLASLPEAARMSVLAAMAAAVPAAAVVPAPAVAPPVQQPAPEQPPQAVVERERVLVEAAIHASPDIAAKITEDLLAKPTRGRGRPAKSAALEVLIACAEGGLPAENCREYLELAKELGA